MGNIDSKEVDNHADDETQPEFRPRSNTMPSLQLRSPRGPCLPACSKSAGSMRRQVSGGLNVHARLLGPAAPAEDEARRTPVLFVGGFLAHNQMAMKLIAK